MKRTFFFLACLVMALGMQAQVFRNTDAGLTKIATIDHPSGWITFKSDTPVQADAVFTQHKSAFGLGQSDEMQISRSENDRIGLRHDRYQQYFQGVPVMGAEFLVHSRAGVAINANGKIVRGLNVNTIPSISGQEAIEKAVAFTAASRYMWEDEANNNMLRHITGDQSATYYPEAELMLMDRGFGTDAKAYRLVWKVNVYAEVPISYRDIFIDAQSGAVYHTLNRLLSDDVPGTAVTKYSGTQTIVTDSVAPGQYRLRESGRGSGIETYDMNTGTSYTAAVDFTDADNNWNNVNADQDEVATDAHFGAEMTYDYYKLVHGRLSYNNLDAKLVSFVHYDVDYANAFWDGTRMTYGDGDNSYSPFTSLDVCAHEVTHGVTQYSANLVYQNEPGAINEAFSDIFGTAVEFYALDSLGDWFIGEDFDIAGDGFRNMADPNSDQLPDTYLGQYWYSGTFDYGGVHTNCGVGAYWFYLLSEGGNGTNDLGNYYQVNGIGIDSAGHIAYRALTVYLTSTSNYSDFRIAALQSAADLYGHCSDAYIQCANAMYAVGIGMAVADYDFALSAITAPTTACGMTTETVSLMLIYNGCNVQVPAGDSIYFYYSLDGGPEVEELFVTTIAYDGGDTLLFSFATPADVTVLGNHTIDARFVYDNDTMNYNDEITGYTFENRLYQNIDLGIARITAPVSSCDLSSAETIEAELVFYGCDFLPSGTDVRVAYSVNGGTTVFDTVTLAADLMPETPLAFSFNPTADLSASGNYSLLAWTAYSPDTLTSNDACDPLVIKKPLVLNDTIVTFEETNINDFILVHTTPYSKAVVSTAAEYTGARGFLMTGGNPMAYLDMIELPDGNNTWTTNEFLSAMVDFCIDATAWSSAYASFDLKQTFGEMAYSTYLGPGDYSIASNLRVLVNHSDQIGSTYNPTTASSDPFTKKTVNLSSYAGDFFTFSLETRNLSKDTLIFVMDNAYIDNVRFSEDDQSGLEGSEVSGQLALYPNPATSVFQFVYYAETNSELTLELLDVTGKSVYTAVYHVYTGENMIRVNPGQISPGLYLLQVNDGQRRSSGKLMIQ